MYGRKRVADSMPTHRNRQPRRRGLWSVCPRASPAFSLRRGGGPQRGQKTRFLKAARYRSAEKRGFVGKAAGIRGPRQPCVYLRSRSFPLRTAARLYADRLSHGRGKTRCGGAPVLRGPLAARCRTRFKDNPVSCPSLHSFFCHPETAARFGPHRQGHKPEPAGKHRLVSFCPQLRAGELEKLRSGLPGDFGEEVHDLDILYYLAGAPAGSMPSMAA